MVSDKGTLSVDDIMDMQVVRCYETKESITLGRSLEEYAQLYREKSPLGKGAMGEVVLVERRSDGVLFAAKKQNDPKFHETFVKEMEMMRKIQHENVVNLIECFQSKEEKQLIIILEYCQCKSFHTLRIYCIIICCRWGSKQISQLLEEVRRDDTGKCRSLLH